MPRDARRELGIASYGVTLALVIAGGASGALLAVGRCRRYLLVESFLMRKRSKTPAKAPQESRAQSHTPAGEDDMPIDVSVPPRPEVIDA